MPNPSNAPSTAPNLKLAARFLRNLTTAASHGTAMTFAMTGGITLAMSAALTLSALTASEAQADTMTGTEMMSAPAAPEARAVTTTGFASGNSRDWTPVRGTVQVQCNDPGYPGFNQQFYPCEGDFFTPDVFDYFALAGHAPAGADQVRLETSWPDHSGHHQTADFDVHTGKSRQRFNLWVQTLLQDPLLAQGMNVVRYTLLKQGHVLARGEFTANVVSHPARECPGWTYFSTTHLDCQGSSSIACRNYFNEFPDLEDCR